MYRPGIKCQKALEKRATKNSIDLEGDETNVHLYLQSNLFMSTFSFICSLSFSDSNCPVSRKARYIVVILIY